MSIDDIQNFLKQKQINSLRDGNLLILNIGKIKKIFSGGVYVDIYDKVIIRKSVVFTAAISIKKGLSVKKKWKVLNEIVGFHFGPVRAYLKEDINQLTFEYFLNHDDNID